MTTRTATALFQSYDRAADTVNKLEAAGIPHGDISIVSNDQAHQGQHGSHPGTGTGASLGTVVGGGAGLLAGLGMLAIPGLGPVVAAGWLASTLLGAGVGAAAGGLVGALTDVGIDQTDADAYAEGVRRGGTLVTVRADEAQLKRATDILDVDGAVDLDERRSAWGQEGWTPGSASPQAGLLGDTGQRATDPVTSGPASTTARPEVGSLGQSTPAGDVGPSGRRVRTY